MSLSGLLLSVLIATAVAREIKFPPVAAVQHPISGLDLEHDNTGLDISQAFAGILTYANLPYVHCLANDGEDVDKYDIAIMGAPFDTVSPHAMIL